MDSQPDPRQIRNVLDISMSGKTWQDSANGTAQQDALFSIQYV
jgi:hypothetical protein